MRSGESMAFLHRCSPSRPLTVGRPTRFLPKSQRRVGPRLASPSATDSAAAKLSRSAGERKPATGSFLPRVTRNSCCTPNSSWVSRASWVQSGLSVHSETWPRWLTRRTRSSRRRHRDLFEGGGGAVVDAERPIDQQHVQPEKADHRPGADREEHEPADETETADQRHHQHEASAGQRAMRRDDRRKKRGLAAGVVVAGVLRGHAALNIGQTWPKRRSKRPAKKRSAAPPRR